MRGIAAVGLALAALLAVAPAEAYPESAAPQLDERVLEAGHLPAVVEPHTQWQGFLRLRPGADVVAASYQICRVGSACFAPPAPAARDGDTFRFDTNDYTALGAPIDYGAGWRIGVKWFLTDAAGNLTELPPAAGCGATSSADCLEREYLAFDIPAARGTPAPLPLLALAVVALAAARRRHG